MKTELEKFYALGASFVTVLRSQIADQLQIEEWRIGSQHLHDRAICYDTVKAS